MTNEQDVAFRIQARILQDTRQELREVQEELKTTKEALTEETARHGNSVLKAQHLERELLLQGAEKDSMITTLKERVNSINNEYNRAFNGGAQASTPKRKCTTLEDVYKITGEGNVR